MPEETKEKKDADFITELKKVEEAGMARTKDWVSLWQESQRYFFSDQLHGKKLKKDWDWVVINYIWSSAVQECAKLSRNYPKILVNPTEDSDTETAEAWQGVLQWQWEKGLNKHGMRIEQIYAIMVGKMFGYRISKIYWEPKVRWSTEKRRWMGDVKHRLWHPAEFWASDTEKIDDGDCGTVRYVDLDWAIHRWPKAETKLRENSLTFRDGLGSATNVRGQIASAGTYPSAGTGGIDAGTGTNQASALLNLILGVDKMSGQQTATEDDRRFVKISEQYMRDFEEVHRKEEEPIPQEELLQAGLIKLNNSSFVDENNKPISADNWPQRLVDEWDEPKYPLGRKIIRNEDTILNPDNQIYPYSRWPFVVTPHYLLPFMWQGMDAVQLYKSAQDMINVSVSHLVNNLKQFGDPRIAIERDAIDAPPGRKKKHFTILSGAGSIIRLARGGLNRYKIEHPVPPSMAAIQLYQLFSQEYKNIVGLQDIATGKKMPGKMTATESSYLAISANDRIHLQSVFEDEWIKQVANLMGECSQLNYDLGRFIRIIGENKVVGATEITQKMKEVKFDIDIEPGQTLPFDEERRVVKYTTAYEMMQNPIANPMLPEMLRVLEIPGWQKLLEKYEAWQLYYQFYNLYEQVKNGEVEPQAAVQMIVQKAMELYAQEQANTVPTVEEKEK